jgi:hypothetical protein
MKSKENLSPMERALLRKQHNQHRASSTHRGRRVGKSNLKCARRPENWKEWLQAVLLKRTFFHKSRPIPVRLRPWVPKVAQALAKHDANAYWLSMQLQAHVPKHQYDHLRTVYPVLHDPLQTLKQWLSEAA